MVYTGQSLSLSALEQLVHLKKPRVLNGYVAAWIAFDDWRARRVAVPDLPPGWNGPAAPAALQQIGDQWIATADTVALAVPSVITPGEWNYLLNPAHPVFSGLSRSAETPFEYDDRLG